MKVELIEMGEFKALQKVFASFCPWIVLVSNCTLSVPLFGKFVLKTFLGGRCQEFIIDDFPAFLFLKFLVEKAKIIKEFVVQKIAEKMQKAGLPARVIDDFLFYRQEASLPKSGYVSEAEIEPLQQHDLAEYGRLPQKKKRCQAKAAVIKLNGGLGTSMGLTRAKSLINVKNGLNFLDIIVGQILARQLQLPLIFMNSFATADDSRAHLVKFSELQKQKIPLDFMQNSYPRLLAKNFELCDFADEEQNWSPPGHGDIYTALEVSGVLQKLLDAGIDYAFISNSDNLGACFDRKKPLATPSPI